MKLLSRHHQCPTTPSPAMVSDGPAVNGSSTYELIHCLYANSDLFLFRRPCPTVPTKLYAMSKCDATGTMLTVWLGYPCSTVGTSAMKRTVAMRSRRKLVAATSKVSPLLRYAASLAHFA